MIDGTIDSTALIEFTRDLVRARGLSGDERPAAQRIKAEMQRLGFDSIEVDALGSVIGVIQGGRPGPTLLMDAHIDTVGISPGVPWDHNPFAAQVEDGKIFGRGCADMKGAAAAMVYAAAGVDRSQLGGRVVVSASTLEEVLEGVALRAVMERYPADFAVIGESTGLNLARGGRGRAEIHLTTTGIPTHSSAPHLGRNAVLDMVKVITAVEGLSLGSDPLMGPAIIALTDIVSDPYPGNSVIPSQCHATYDRRLLPGESAEAVLAEITRLPGVQGIQLDATIPTATYAAYTGTEVTAEKFFPAWVLPEEHAFVRAALSGLTSAGLQPSVGAYRFCTNAAYSAGIAHVPTIGFGPATEEDAHRTDERLSLDDLKAAAAGYAGIIYKVLGDGLFTG